MRTWRNWQTRRFQVPVVKYRVGSNPFVRTKKIDLFQQVDFFGAKVVAVCILIIKINSKE